MSDLTLAKLEETLAELHGEIFFLRAVFSECTCDASLVGRAVELSLDHCEELISEAASTDARIGHRFTEMSLRENEYWLGPNGRNRLIELGFPMDKD